MFLFPIRKDKVRNKKAMNTKNMRTFLTIYGKCLMYV